MPTTPTPSHDPPFRPQAITLSLSSRRSLPANVHSQVASEPLPHPSGPAALHPSNACLCPPADRPHPSQHPVAQNCHNARESVYRRRCVHAHVRTHTQTQTHPGCRSGWGQKRVASAPASATGSGILLPCQHQAKKKNQIAPLSTCSDRWHHVTRAVWYHVIMWYLAPRDHVPSSAHVRACEDQELRLHQQPCARDERDTRRRTETHRGTERQMERDTRRL